MSGVKKIVSWVLLTSVLSCGGGIVQKSRAEVDWRHVGIAGAVGLFSGVCFTKWLSNRCLAKRPDQKQDFPFTIYHEKTFDDFVGHELVKKQVNEFIQDLGASNSKGLLIEGAQGNGKTLLANIIANKLDAELLCYSGYDFVGKSGEEQEDTLGWLLHIAQEKSKGKFTILFVDDLNVLCKNSQGYMQKIFRMVTEFLKKIRDDENFLLIGAINDASVFDNTLLRRAGIERIKIFPPNRADRKAILEHYLKKINLEPEISVKDFVKKLVDDTAPYLIGNIAAEDLKNFVEMAAQNSRREHSEFVTECHFKKVLNNIQLGFQKELEQTKDELRRIAIHEAGHVLVAILTGKKVFQANIVSRENALGVVWSGIGHEYWVHCDKKDWLHKIMIGFGGYCSEKILLGEVSLGVGSDLSSVNSLASQMVDLYGMGDGLEGLTTEFVKSDLVIEKFDKAMLAILQRCRGATEALLERHQDKIMILADALLEKERLTEEEIYALVGNPDDISEEFLEAYDRAAEKECDVLEKRLTTEKIIEKKSLKAKQKPIVVEKQGDIQQAKTDLVRRNIEFDVCIEE